MLAVEREGENTVIEIIPKFIHAIMTVQTRIPKGSHMVDHERCVDLTMASFAGLLIENRDIGSMTIPTLERLLISFERMAA